MQVHVETGGGTIRLRIKTLIKDTVVARALHNSKWGCLNRSARISMPSSAFVADPVGPAHRAKELPTLSIVDDTVDLVGSNHARLFVQWGDVIIHAWNMGWPIHRYRDRPWLGLRSALRIVDLAPIRESTTPKRKSSSFDSSTNAKTPTGRGDQNAVEIKHIVEREEAAQRALTKMEWQERSASHSVEAVKIMDAESEAAAASVRFLWNPPRQDISSETGDSMPVLSSRFFCLGRQMEEEDEDGSKQLLDWSEGDLEDLSKDEDDATASSKPAPMLVLRLQGMGSKEEKEEDGEVGMVSDTPAGADTRRDLMSPAEARIAYLLYRGDVDRCGSFMKLNGYDKSLKVCVTMHLRSRGVRPPSELGVHSPDWIVQCKEMRLMLRRQQRERLTRRMWVHDIRLLDFRHPKASPNARVFGKWLNEVWMRKLNWTVDQSSVDTRLEPTWRRKYYMPLMLGKTFPMNDPRSGGAGQWSRLGPDRKMDKVNDIGVPYESFTNDWRARYVWLPSTAHPSVQTFTCPVTWTGAQWGVSHKNDVTKTMLSDSTSLVWGVIRNHVSVMDLLTYCVGTAHLCVRAWKNSTMKEKIDVDDRMTYRWVWIVYWPDEKLRISDDDVRRVHAMTHNDTWTLSTLNPSMRRSHRGGDGGDDPTSKRPSINVQMDEKVTLKNDFWKDVPLTSSDATELRVTPDRESVEWVRSEQVIVGTCVI
jgi:hypothetical protein